MPRTAAYVILLVLPVLIFMGARSAEADTVQIKGPNVRVQDSMIQVSGGLQLDDKHRDEISKGVSKEIVFYFDLFRKWNNWPDEFILGETFTQTLRCDPVKKEFISTSLRGRTLKEKRFKSCDSLLRWALNIKEFSLTNINELEPAMYTLKITVESRLRRVPPFIKLFLFFVKETEFREAKNSPYFMLKERP